MAEDDVRKVTEAAAAVMKALEPLSQDERVRVLDSTSALYGVVDSARRSKAGAGDEDMHEIRNEPGGRVRTREKPLSIVEFLAEKKPVTNAQRIACFAHYRENVEGKPNFARGDLETYFSTAKLAKPGNYDRDFSSAAREGWIHEDGASSYLTQNGERAVAQGFEGKAKPRGLSAPRRKKAASAT